MNLRRLFNPDSELTLIPILAATLVVYLLLHGCATTPQPLENFRTVTYEGAKVISWETCKPGVMDYATVYVYRSAVPTIGCMEMSDKLGKGFGEAFFMASVFALACTWTGEHIGVMVLPYGAPQWMIDHEEKHVAHGDYHASPIPFIHNECPNKYRPIEHWEK
jgi:hypothetical protein